MDKDEGIVYVVCTINVLEGGSRWRELNEDNTEGIDDEMLLEAGDRTTLLDNGGSALRDVCRALGLYETVFL